MARTITFQPSSSMSEFIETMVQTGDYNNQSEVIRAALRLLQEQNAASKLNQLRSLFFCGLPKLYFSSELTRRRVVDTLQVDLFGTRRRVELL